MSNVAAELLDVLKPEGGQAIITAGQTFAGRTAAVQVAGTAVFTSVTTPAGKPIVSFAGGGRTAATGFTLPAGIYYFEMTGFVCDVNVVAYLNARPSLTA